MFKLKGDFISKNSNGYGSSKAGKVPVMGRELGMPTSSAAQVKQSQRGQAPAVDFTKDRNNNAENDSNGNGKMVASRAQRRAGGTKSFGK